jgi:hypothetical protein
VRGLEATAKVGDLLIGGGRHDTLLIWWAYATAFETSEERRDELPR